MKQFDFNKTKEVVNFMEKNNATTFITECGVEIFLIKEGNFTTYSICSGERERVIDDNLEVFLKRVANYYSGGGRD